MQQIFQGDCIYCENGVLKCGMDCMAEIRLAIKERQLAAGITDAWDSNNPADTSRLIQADPAQHTYTLSDLKAYVNYVAPCYLDGVYTGGSEYDPNYRIYSGAHPPLSDTYADAAATCDELFALVRDMLQTFGYKSGSSVYEYSWDISFYEGYSEGHDTQSAAIAAAEADYKDVGTYQKPTNSRYTVSLEYGGWKAWVRSGVWSIAYSPHVDAPPRTFEIFVKCDQDPAVIADMDEFNQQGCAWAVNSTTYPSVGDTGYWSVGSTSSGLNFDLPSLGTIPGYWAAADTTAGFAFHPFVAITWDFEYV